MDFDGFDGFDSIEFDHGHSVPNSTMAFGRPSIPTVPFRRFRFRFDAIPIRCNSDSAIPIQIQPLLPFFDSDRSILTVLIPTNSDTRCNSDSNHSGLFPCSSHEYFDIVIHSICAHKKGPIFFDTTPPTTSYISKFQVCMVDHGLGLVFSHLLPHCISFFVVPMYQ